MGLGSWIASVVARATRDRSPNTQGTGRAGERTVAGVYIDTAMALKVSTVWACHRYLTTTVAQLPARVMREMPGGATSVRVPNHPVNNVLSWRANPELGPFQLKETLSSWAILRGNGIAEIERDLVGRIVNLWPIHPDRVEFRRDVITQQLVYRIDNGPGREKIDLEPSEVFHLRGYGDGPVGLNVIEFAASTIGWSKAAELFGAAFFGNGLNGGGFIEGGPKLDQGSLDRLYNEIDERHRGPRRAHRPVYLDAGMKYTKSSATPDEAQFVATMQFQVEEICRWFGVPPQKVGHLLRMTFNNVEQLSIEVVVDTITPWVIRFEDEANYKLFGMNRGNYFCKLDLKGLLRGAFKDRQEGLEVQRRNGIINAEDWREIEDMGPMGSPAAKKYIVMSNMTTLEKIGEQAPPSAPQTPPPGEEKPAQPEQKPPTPEQAARIVDLLARHDLLDEDDPPPPDSGVDDLAA